MVDHLPRGLELTMQGQALRLVRHRQASEHRGEFDGVVQTPMQLPIQAGQGVKRFKPGVRQKQQQRADVHAWVHGAHPGRLDRLLRPHHGLFRVSGGQHKGAAQGQVRSAGSSLEGNRVDTRPVSAQRLSCLGIRVTQYQGEQVLVSGAEQAVGSQ